VLVVVLGVLAILAVIGVAFITMAAIERSSARSFAVQTQMRASADGAVDFVSHYLVSDLWYGPSADRFLLKEGPFGDSEAYDVAGQVDDWLSGCIDSAALAPDHFAFAYSQDHPKAAGVDLSMYGITLGRLGAKVDNLAFPAGARSENGIWNWQLTHPLNEYVVLASVTVIDHGGLINLNAHGNRYASDGDWMGVNEEDATYHTCAGKGYFISDVDPGALTGIPDDFVQRLLEGYAPGGGPDEVYGRWSFGGDVFRPANGATGQTWVENPSGGLPNIPFSLAEEFELRRLSGTYFRSRIEWMYDDMNADPDNAGPHALRRLRFTTQSWTSEMRGDGKSDEHVTAEGEDWSAPKADINKDDAKTIYNALKDIGAIETGTTDSDGKKFRQFCANVVGFRRKTGHNTPVSVGDPDDAADPVRNYMPAERQPVFALAGCQLAEMTGSAPDPDDDESEDTRKRKYKVRVWVTSPWPGPYAGSTAGLGSGLKVTFEGPRVSGTGEETISSSIAYKDWQSGVLEVEVQCHEAELLPQGLDEIRLWKHVSGKNLVLDKIGKQDIEAMTFGVDEVPSTNWKSIRRQIHVADETRGETPADVVKVVYFSDWAEGGNAGDADPVKPYVDNKPDPKIPVRFPNCVPGDDEYTGMMGHLPVRASAAGGDCKAFPRLGDLNQVLRFAPGDDQWWAQPWILYVTGKIGGTETEDSFKWNWKHNSGGAEAALAANALCVDSPWADEIDNDGDGDKDWDDDGKTGAGRFGGPETRVNGKINLNTATDETFEALGAGVGLSGSQLKALCDGGPLVSPADILDRGAPAVAASDTMGPLEERDIYYTRISNIATTRSDTFSIYGTVQLVLPPTATGGGVVVMRTRHFWAMVDRSPSLAYSPSDKQFIHPRVMNFQWLN
jgi:hypothetical protein